MYSSVQPTHRSHKVGLVTAFEALGACSILVALGAVAEDALSTLQVPTILVVEWDLNGSLWVSIANLVVLLLLCRSSSLMAGHQILLIARHEHNGDLCVLILQ